MNKLLLFFLAALPFGLSGQIAQQEINAQVWKPFIKTFSELDTEGFMALHSKEVVRSPRDDKMILDWAAYFNEQKAGDDRARGTGRKRTIDLRFTERISTGDNAIDVGVYKTSSINAKGEERSFFGRFHVVLRKENGTWKIRVDTDSSEGGTIGEKDFLAAKPME